MSRQFRLECSGTSPSSRALAGKHGSLTVRQVANQPVREAPAAIAHAGIGEQSRYLARGRVLDGALARVAEKFWP